MNVLHKGQLWVCYMLLIGRVSGVVARPRPPCGALSARVVSTAQDVVNQSALECREGGGWRALGRQVDDGVQCAAKYGETEAVR